MKVVVTFALALPLFVFGTHVAAAQAPSADNGSLKSTSELEEKANILAQINNVHQARIGSLSGMCFENASSACMVELSLAIAQDRAVVNDGFEVIDQLEARLREQQDGDSRQEFANLTKLRQAFLDSQMNDRTYEVALNERLSAQNDGAPALAGR